MEGSYKVLDARPIAAVLLNTDDDGTLLVTNLRLLFVREETGSISPLGNIPLAAIEKCSKIPVKGQSAPWQPEKIPSRRLLQVIVSGEDTKSIVFGFLPGTKQRRAVCDALHENAAEKQWLDYQVKKAREAEEYPVGEDADAIVGGVAMHAAEIRDLDMQSELAIHLSRCVAMDYLKLVQTPGKNVEIYTGFPLLAGTMISAFRTVDELGNDLNKKLRARGVLPGFLEDFLDINEEKNRKRFEGFRQKGFRALVARVVQTDYSTKLMGDKAQAMADYAETALDVGLVPAFWNKLEESLSKELLTHIRQRHPHLFLCDVLRQTRGGEFV